MLEGGWGERRLERETGIGRHRKTGWCLGWRCRRVVGVLSVAKMPSTMAVGQECWWERERGQGVSSVGATARKRDGAFSESAELSQQKQAPGAQLIRRNGSSSSRKPIGRLQVI